jgi:hypothetical protein
VNLHERNMVETTITQAVNNYRSGPWSNAEVIAYILKALDAEGLFKDPLAPVEAPSKPTTTSETISGSEAMKSVSVECDESEYDGPYLYCVECGNALDTEVGGQYLAYLIIEAAAHWKENHA